jgi:ubiquinone/menaquinone biosynthesis C-methylase UbiE
MRETYLRTKDFLVSGKEFELVWNEEHKCLQTSPVPQDLEAYYQSPDYISHSDRAETFFEKIYQRAKKINLKRKLRMIEKNHKGEGVLMDVGAGTGDFVRHAQMNGWEAYGVEPNDQARERAHQKGVSVYKSLGAQKDPAYDVVTYWHVFEHLQDLEGSIEEVSAVIKPGGCLVIAVPNYRSLDARYYKERWAAFDVPRHLWHFSRDSIKHLFIPKGYQLLSVKPLWLDAFYISWLSETYKKRKLAPILGFAVGLISNLYGLFSQEYSSHVYILRKEPN